MEVVHPVCCGLDVHQASIAACVRRTSPDGSTTSETREFSTVFKGLTELLEWLTESKCPVAAMESTGIYWKPVFNVLSGGLDVWVVNARDVKPRRGRKTDRKDAQWIADLLAHGLIRPSYIPPPEIRALRDLIRARTVRVQQRTQCKNRALAVLEDSNIKMSTFVSNPFGVSGRKMLDALVAGVRDPEVLADMARGILRRKIPLLKEAMAGGFTKSHAFFIQQELEMIDLINLQIARLEEEAQALLESMSEDLDRLVSIPGVSRTAGAVIISEMGRDMSRFGSAGRLASWAGMCPGNNESAGKRLSGRTRKGNRHLRRVLVECGWAASRTDSFLGDSFHRLKARIGAKRAAMAIGHKILVIAYHLLSEEKNLRQRKVRSPRPEHSGKEKKRSC